MNPTSKYTIGLRFGLLTGLLYVILLFLRYNFFTSSPVAFGLFALVSYLIILTMYVFTGIARRKELGGFASLKEIFQAIFIAILIAEFIYILFNFIYIKFVDPQFWTNYRATTLNYLQSKGLTDEQIDQQMKLFKDVDKQNTPGGLIKGYGFSVIIDCVFGLIIAAILKKKKAVFEEILEEPKP